VPSPPRKVLCWKHGGVMLSDIAPIGPTLTRPALHVIPRVFGHDELYGAKPDCEHYVTYANGGGVRCIRCPGWFCL
jgi:hypothetical protein